jgi:Ca2+-binding EF-hand superfamily protein
VSTLADPSVVEQLVRGLTETQRDELREAFFYVDGNRDGQIVYEEFSKLLTSLRANVGEAQCRDGFLAIDANRDGSIAFDEFAAWYLG